MRGSANILISSQPGELHNAVLFPSTDPSLTAFPSPLDLDLMWFSVLPSQSLEAIVCGVTLSQGSRVVVQGFEALDGVIGSKRCLYSGAHPSRQLTVPALYLGGFSFMVLSSLLWTLLLPWSLLIY